MDSLTDIVCEMAAVPAGPEEYHEEGSVLQHTVKVIEEIQTLRPSDPDAFLIAFFHDVGKLRTPDDHLPNHYDHDELGAELIAELPESILPADSRQKAKIVAEQHMRFKKLPVMKASKVIRLVETLDDTYLSAELMVDFLEADRLGREPALETDRDQFETRIEAVREADSRLGDVDIANDQHRLQKKIEFYRELVDTSS